MLSFYNYKGTDVKLTENLLEVLCLYSTNYKLHYHTDTERNESRIVSRLKKNMNTTIKEYNELTFLSPNIPEEIPLLFHELLEESDYIRFIPIISEVEYVIGSLEMTKNLSALDPFSSYIVALNQPCKEVFKNMEAKLIGQREGHADFIQICESQHIPRGITLFSNEVQLLSREVIFDNRIAYTLNLPINHVYSPFGKKGRFNTSVLEGEIEGFKSIYKFFAHNEFPYSSEWSVGIPNFKYLTLYTSDKRQIAHIDAINQTMHLCLNTDELASLLDLNKRNEGNSNIVNELELIKCEMTYEPARDSFSLQFNYSSGVFWEDFSQQIISGVKEMNLDDLKF